LIAPSVHLAAKPVLILFGAQDSIVPAENAASLAAGATTAQPWGN
jgi:hypothetical protein